MLERIFTKSSGIEHYIPTLINFKLGALFMDWNKVGKTGLASPYAKTIQSKDSNISAFGIGDVGFIKYL